jgi:hypothetical protein
VSRLRLAPSLGDVCIISKLASHLEKFRQVVRTGFPPLAKSLQPIAPD